MKEILCAPTNESDFTMRKNGDGKFFFKRGKKLTHKLKLSPPRVVNKFQYYTPVGDRWKFFFLFVLFKYLQSS